MKLTLFLLLSSTAWAGRQVYVTDAFQSLDAARWTVTGRIVPSRAGLTAPDAEGGTALSRIAIPPTSKAGEVRMKVALAASGGAYSLLLRDARSGASVAVEMQNPVLTPQGCTAGYAILQRRAGSVWLIASVLHSCRDGMEMRMSLRGGTLLAWLDQDTPLEFPVMAADTDFASARLAGVAVRGTPQGNAISAVEISAPDTAPPPAVETDSLRFSAFRRRVDLQWKPVDPAAASLIVGYWIYRDGAYFARTKQPVFSDEAAAPGTRHTYTVYAVDQDYNFSNGTSVTVSTPLGAK